MNVSKLNVQLQSTLTVGNCSVGRRNPQSANLYVDLGGGGSGGEEIPYIFCSPSPLHLQNLAGTTSLLSKSLLIKNTGTSAHQEDRMKFCFSLAISCIAVALCHGYCFLQPNNEGTEYEGCVDLYDGQRHLFGSTWNTAECLKCRCDERGMECCSSRFRTFASSQLE
ncbi:hypothetical protein JRQ81_011155 [Phrynocephalus forsythii]|uniref:Beta-microseminoprotein n=1 Tax=Phrynocephalus forsythii TaxID=171643 RepID=A0A9Q0X7J9_9SAUR|nr:hypothetical protein JRQ81_011155 [Phrynocephalus forsythii]